MPRLSDNLNLFSRFGGLFLSSSYKFIMASSSKRLFSSVGAIESPFLARDNDFRNNWPHFLRAAA